MTIGLRLLGEPFWDFNQIFRSAEINLYQFEGIDANFIYRITSTLLIAPVLEELFFRKFLLSELNKKYSKFHSALCFSALCFSTIIFCHTLGNSH